MRNPVTPERWEALSQRIQDAKRTLAERAALRFRLFLEEEQIVRNAGERIYGWRTVPDFPDIYAPGEKEARTAGMYVHEQGRVCNLCSDWEGVLREGLLSRRARAPRETAECIDAVFAYVDRYEDAQLSRALRTGATSFLEALQMLRLLHLCLWVSNVYHNTLGRFDQYMYPYYCADRESGRLTDEEALSLVEEFFLSLNRDSDLYSGMQQGDNGQSMMLGGCDAEGKCAVNELTYLCLTASLHNHRIDPKLNLRVDKKTVLSLFERCTELTRQGLGFPQYANDDVVIPALQAMGYSEADARNYTVAACWEFIVPGVGMDIPNIGAVSLAGCVHDVIEAHVAHCDTFDALFEKVREELFRRADALEASLRPLYMEPAPFQTALMSDCTRDVSQGARYNNYGIHGTGFATAVDQLAAVHSLIYDKRCLSGQALLDALASPSSELLYSLRREMPKLGRDRECERIADMLLEAFADSWQDRRNERGGIFRPGTGTAMYSLWHAENLGACADGRLPGEPLSANFSPSLLLSDVGPLSVLKAMARPGLARVMNGGPVTMELHDTVFRTLDSLTKVAMLVRSFLWMGGHQLQLNAMSRETLLDAQAHPEAHENLIVRVWGWSGHFVRLDRVYQDQILRRTCYEL